MDEFGGRDAAEMVIGKDFGRLLKGEIGLSISDSKAIMAGLQQLVVKRQWVSRPRELRPRPLAEPDVILSNHPAPIIRP